MEGEENIPPLNNPEDKSTDELSQEHPSLQFTNDSIDAEANEGSNDLPQIIMENETAPAGLLQPNTDEDTIINE